MQRKADITEPMEPASERPATDEVIENGRKESDLDSRMFAGCFLFSAACVMQFLVVWIPFLVSDPIFEWQGLRTAALVAFGLGLLVGCAFTVGGGFVGYLGSIAGTMPACVYIVLRLREAALGIPQGTEMVFAEYTEAVAWFLPAAYVLVGVGIWGAAYGVAQRLFNRRR
ncbi:MAG: hypothetical protein KatS3mg015_0718 [Fimbriimonadales bacterium]|nr:MAG: hypothetical protein KatS3mg015_0718 [Fimbriimonadales bacterium]